MKTSTTAGVNARNWVDPPYNRIGFVRTSDFARTQPISRGPGPALPLPRAERELGASSFEFAGQTVSFTEMLDETFTDALLVLRDGVVVHEAYPSAMTSYDTHLLMSVSKSITATLCGIHAGRGALHPDDLVTDHLNELRGSSWDDCTIQHLLDMRCGVRWVYDEDEFDIFDVSDYRQTDRTDLPPDTASWIRSIAPAGPHGGAFRYVSLASDVLGWVLEHVGGAPLATLITREIWSQLGAERDAEIVVDSSGFAVAEGGICTALRDLGRFGQLCLDGGVIDGRQVIPRPWLDRLRIVDSALIEAYSSAPEYDAALPGAFYHDNWWIEDAAAGIYSALGVYGQTLLIHHPTRSVVVKLSSHPAPEDPELWALQRAGVMALCENV
jgi:CubicO group peptidase (beta-lactamase class C family)